MYKDNNLNSFVVHRLSNNEFLLLCIIVIYNLIRKSHRYCKIKNCTTYWSKTITNIEFRTNFLY